MSYDTALEGPLGLVLYRYDKDTLLFNEVAQAFRTPQDQQSHLLSMIQEDGTYVIALESLTSTKDKFQIDSKTVKQKGVFVDPCLHIAYSYYIGSL